MSRHRPAPAIPMRQLHGLWREFVDLPFPTGVAGQEAAGLDLAALDHEAGLLVERYLEAEGRTPAATLDALASCHERLGRVLGASSGDAHAYFVQLEMVVRHVLDAARPPALV